MTTIAAIATPLGVGGISVIRLSGPEALRVAGRCFRPFNGEDLAAKPGYTACYGRFLHSDGSVLDDGVVLVYHAPHSYTGEDVAELSCHGGVYVTRQLLRRCLECGAVAAQPGDRLLLCSDGLSNVLSDQQLLEICRHGGLEECCRQLMARTLEAGAPDNVTIVMAQL